MRLRLYFVLVSVLIAGDYAAQSPQFSQFYANQVYLNPAFTGNTQINRLAANYRNQWAGIPKAFVSYSLAYDHNLAIYNLGLGLIAVRDQAGTGGLSYTNFSGLVSYKFQIRENLMTSVGISYGASIRAANTSKYTFGDEFISGGPTTANIDRSKSYGDFASGFVVYNDAFWGGLSAAHLNRPNESLVFSNEERTPVQWSLHGGYNFILDATEKGDVEKSIIVTTNYKFSSKFDQIDFGFYYQRRKLLTGAWYRGIPLLKRNDDGKFNKDAVVLMIGMKVEGFRMGYSYDITASRLSVRDSYGSHEISLTYEWPTRVRKKKKRKRSFIIPCPKF